MTKNLFVSKFLLLAVFASVVCPNVLREKAAASAAFKKYEPSARYSPGNIETKSTPVYLKLEAEDFFGIGADGEKSAWQQNMSWHPQWSRGGASGWWGVRGLASFAAGEINRDIYVPQDGEYVLWARYQDYFGKAEPFSVIVDFAGGSAAAEYGRADTNSQLDPQTRWHYAWSKKLIKLKKGEAKVRITLKEASEVTRDVDALILTNDASWVPKERGFPPQAYSNYLLKWAQHRTPLKPLIENNRSFKNIPREWILPKIGGRDFWYLGASEIVKELPFPINVRPEFKNPNNVKAFVERYQNNPQTAPIFSSSLTALQISISQVGELLNPANPLRQYILTHKRPFVLVGNYGSAGKIPGSYQKLEQAFGNLWLGIVSGENSYLNIPLLPENSAFNTNFKVDEYQWLLAGGKNEWRQKISADWASEISHPFEKVIPALSVGTLARAHQFAEAGANIIAAESAGAMPYVQAQAAFVRSAGRQYQKPWLWYFGASFGSAIRTFTSEEPYIIDLEGTKIDSRNATIGPSLAHIRRALLFSYLQGANFIFPEQGYNLFDVKGQINPMGWSYDEMLRLAAKHPNRGVINTPVALLLDKSHGWDKYTYNGMRLWDKKTLRRSDQMINQFFNVAYYPFPKNEGDPATDLNVPYPNGYYGDIFDVLVTSPSQLNSLQAYQAIFCLGNTQLDSKWTEQLKKYVRDGGTLVINSKQIVPGLDESFLGVKFSDKRKESGEVICDRDNEVLTGSIFPYQFAAPISAQIIAHAANGDGIAFINKIGKGQVITTTASYLMGYDEVAMPYLPHLLLELTSGLQPIDVRGNCQYFINLRPDGYVVTLSNNEGIEKLSYSEAKINLSKTSEITLQIKEKPVSSEDWLGDSPQPWNFSNEWLPEYTQPKPLLWEKIGNAYKTTVKLLPGEIRVYFLKSSA